ncbi:hypothetical protein [Enterovibrio baiacu]|uniref:hypothetical protein n=1 Tax=Enterovibrio baiacu TaxID=2491023 RepID=UPI0010123F22|nr:hypothetical protein [Enterovibrio baiacu]MBE1275076.1 hypothetical protein [Enterovibrio baiacu]
MQQAHFAIPEYPKITYAGISRETLSRKTPNFLNSVKWYARVGISFTFIFFASVTTFSCYLFDLTDDIFFIATLAITFFLYLCSLPLLTKIIISSERVRQWVRKSKHRYFLKALANTPFEARLNASNIIWETLRSDEWATCINDAHEIDRERTVYCCQQLGKIASNLIDSDPEIFSDAMLKTMNNQRGSAPYFFDILVRLAEQQFHNEHESQRKLRGTQKLMLDDIFSHR